MTDDEILKTWRQANGTQPDYGVFGRMVIDFARALESRVLAEREPVAWYVPDENGKPFKTTGYSHEALQWKAAGMTVLPLTHPTPDDAKERYREVGVWDTDGRKFRTYAAENLNGKAMYVRDAAMKEQKESGT